LTILRDEISLDHVRIEADVCTHSSENINCEPVTEKAHCSMVLLQQYGLKLLKLCNLEF